MPEATQPPTEPASPPRKRPPKPEGYLDIREAADRAGYSVANIRLLYSQGKLKAYRQKHGHQLLFIPEDVDSIGEVNEVEKTKKQPAEEVKEAEPKQPKTTMKGQETEQPKAKPADQKPTLGRFRIGSRLLGQK